MSFLRSAWYALPNLVRFVIRRLFVGLLLCLGITLVSFALTQVVPGDPVSANLGDRAASDPEIVAAFRARYGLDKPVPQQYLLYLEQYLPATIELATAAMILALVLGITLGVVAAIGRDRWPDQVIRVISLAGVSIPTFWLALVTFYIFFFKLGIAPGVGRLNPGGKAPPSITNMFTIDALLSGQWTTLGIAASHLVLPATVLAIYTVGSITRFTRAAMLESLSQDYVRAARAKGLPERTVILRHALRPALAAIVTVAGMAFGRMLSGTVLVESVFSWPGIGQYAYKSALALDLRAIMGVSLVVAAIYILVNMAVDIIYALIDPRIRLG